MSKQAPPNLRNNITRWIWAIVLIPSTAIALALSAAALGVGAHIFLMGINGNLSLPSLPGISPQLQGIAALGVIALPMLLLAILVRYTYGGEFVDESVESTVDHTEDVKDTIDENT